MDALTEPVQSRISALLKKKLQRYCQKYDKAESEVIRLLLKKFLKNTSAKKVQKGEKKK